MFVAELEPEPAGLQDGDPRWRVPWLEDLLAVPSDATWPRLMTVPHPSAAGSLGPEFILAAEERSGRPLRWWQRLVATRALEVDVDGRLVWEGVVLSLARQLGKSWLLRELLLWRIHQADRFGEPQDVMHTGKDLAVCKEVQRPARLWAKAQPDVFKVREVNGQEEIELKSDGSRWMLRAKEAVYGFSVSLGAVDEAWKVKPGSVDEGLTPTMVEREQPQLWLVSTAHRLATPLMIDRRFAALEHLETGHGDLIVEWSAGPDAEIDDVDAWKAASPHWTTRRERLVRSKLEQAQMGRSAHIDELDPVMAFRSQWLNQWPRVPMDQESELLLPSGVWDRLAEPELQGTGRVWVAVEDDYGLGATVAVAGELPDGRVEVDGWFVDDWDRAIGDVRRLVGGYDVQAVLVGASMLAKVPLDLVPAPEPAGSRETRAGLSLFRDLAIGGMVAHDSRCTDLDEPMLQARVREAPSGLIQTPGEGVQLVKACVWAVAAAVRPTQLAAVA